MLGAAGYNSGPDTFEYWPENAVSLSVFMYALRDLNWSASEVAIKASFKQSVIWELIDRHPQAPSDKSEKWTIFEDLMTLEGVMQNPSEFIEGGHGR